MQKAISILLILSLCFSIIISTGSNNILCADVETPEESSEKITEPISSSSLFERIKSIFMIIKDIIFQLTGNLLPQIDLPIEIISDKEQENTIADEAFKEPEHEQEKEIGEIKSDQKEGTGYPDYDHKDDTSKEKQEQEEDLKNQNIEELGLSDLTVFDIRKLIEGVPPGSAFPLFMILHPSDIGHIVYPSDVNTSTCYIGDSTSNTDVRGFFAFDTSPLTGKTIIDATLFMEGTIIGDPSFKEDIGMRWGSYLPLNADDYMMLGLVRPVDTFNNDENPIIYSEEDLTVVTDTDANTYHNKLQFGIRYHLENSNNDSMTDGIEYTAGNISLIVTYQN